MIRAILDAQIFVAGLLLGWATAAVYLRWALLTGRRGVRGFDGTPRGLPDDSLPPVAEAQP